jgi:hypothetical protein
MIQLFIASAFIALLAALVATFIALKIQSRSLIKLQGQQEAWQRAQEAHQRTWEVKQGSHALDIEKKLSGQVRQVEENRHSWEARDEKRIAAMSLEFQALMGKLNLEHALAKLPRIDETPLPSNENERYEQPFKNWQLPTFCGTDLSGRDLSNRYLVRADFREAQLTGTNFYMADLRGACLTGADLSGADLSGADLSGADLRSAILKGANFLVADMHSAILNGADLRGVRNLTVDQAYSAIFDNATQFDADFDATLPRIPSIRFTVYTESTPLVSLHSSPYIKQLEIPRNTVEAEPVVASTEQDQVEDLEDHPQVDISHMTLPETPIPVEVPETADEKPEAQDSAVPETIPADDVPETPRDLPLDLFDTIPQPAISETDLYYASEEPVSGELETVADETPSSSDVPDIPTGPLDETLEQTSIQSTEASDGDLIEQTSTESDEAAALVEQTLTESDEAAALVEQTSEATKDSQWMIPEVANHSNENSEHQANGTSTNGTSSMSSDLVPLMEQQVDDALLTPPPSNGNSHDPMDTGPRSDTQGNKRTGEAGRATPRKSKNGRRRARAN